MNMLEHRLLYDDPKNENHCSIFTFSVFRSLKHYRFWDEHIHIISNFDNYKYDVFQKATNAYLISSFISFRRAIF